MIVPTGDSVSSLTFLHMSHTPLGPVKAEISAQSGLSSEASEVTGQLVAALVDVVFKNRILVSDKCSLNASLNKVCSETFITIHHTIMRRYGWEYDADSNAATSFQEKQEAMDEALGAVRSQNTTTSCRCSHR